MCLIPFAAGSILFIIYASLPDSPETRANVPMFWWLSLITVLLCGIWTIIYITWIYEDPVLYDYSLYEEDESKRYTV